MRTDLIMGAVSSPANALTEASRFHAIERAAVLDESITSARFTDALRTIVDRIDADQTRAAAMMTAVDTGRSDDLVGAMIASQKAGLSFSALVQIRNKLVAGFDDIMRMPL
ncbi:MAG: flagellar hook-basal body complex protein FliE [Spongiibacteraceae bacterium]|jgi:flagellar hook-basal body complex protein FliE|nr:flagellar hook-basal body complex protein FliE [Spongiibacteraceae bacterium]